MTGSWIFQEVWVTDFARSGGLDLAYNARAKWVYGGLVFQPAEGSAMSQPPYRALQVALRIFSVLFAVGGLFMIFGN